MFVLCGESHGPDCASVTYERQALGDQDLEGGERGAGNTIRSLRPFYAQETVFLDIVIGISKTPVLRQMAAASLSWD